MHSQCHARPTVTFPAAEHQRTLANTKLHCLATKAHVSRGVDPGGVGPGHSKYRLHYYRRLAKVSAFMCLCVMVLWYNAVAAGSTQAKPMLLNWERSGTGNGRHSGSEPQSL